jgi:hypothetical protein
MKIKGSSATEWMIAMFSIRASMYLKNIGCNKQRMIFPEVVIVAIRCNSCV